MDDLKERINILEGLLYANRGIMVKKDITVTLNDILDSVSNIDYNLLMSVMQTILMAIEDEDYVLVADCFEYGIKAFMNKGQIPVPLVDGSLNHIPEINEDIYYLASFLDEEPILCVNNLGKTVRMNSLFSPTNEAKWCKKGLEVKKTTPLVCLFGIGTGLLPSLILDQLLPDGKMFIFEPDRKIIDFCLDSGEKAAPDDIEGLIAKRIKRIIEDKRVILCIEENDEDRFAKELDANVNHIEFAGMIVTKNAGYVTLYPKSCLKYYNEINKVRESFLGNKNTYTLFRDEWIVNPLRNIIMCQHFNLCSELWKIIPTDIPVVIVSAGPSLDKNIEQLRILKGHALLFAVDTALKYLLKKGIVPDLTITIDPRKKMDNYEIEEAYNIPCIFSENSNPLIIEKHKSNFILLDGQEGYIEKILKLLGKSISPTFGTGGSVATAAFSVAYMMKSNTVVLVGQDLAYSGENSHAGGVQEKKSYENTYVEDINGNPIRTRSDWVSYLRWFEDAIKTYKKNIPNSKIIDATEGGAKIHGADTKTLLETIEDLKDSGGNLREFDFSSELRKLPCLLNENEYARFCKLHKGFINNLRVIRVEVEEAIRECDMLINGIEEKRVSDNYLRKENKKMQVIREKVENNPLFTLIDLYIKNDDSEELIRLELEDGDKTIRQSNLIEAMKLIFKSYLSGIDKVYEVAKENENLLRY